MPFPTKMSRSSRRAMILPARDSRPRDRAASAKAASRGCAPSDARSLPLSVMVPVDEMAESERRDRCADSTADGGGEVTQLKDRGSAIPHAAKSRSGEVRSLRKISGSRNGRRARCSCSVHSLTHTPGAVRPARPARWSAASRDIGSVVSDALPLASTRETLCKPVSITTRTPSMVRLVSAMVVASTTLRRPFGSGCMARDCSS